MVSFIAMNGILANSLACLLVFSQKLFVRSSVAESLLQVFIWNSTAAQLMQTSMKQWSQVAFGSEQPYTTTSNTAKFKSALRAESFVVWLLIKFTQFVLKCSHFFFSPEVLIFGSIKLFALQAWRGMEKVASFFESIFREDGQLLKVEEVRLSRRQRRHAVLQERKHMKNV